MLLQFYWYNLIIKNVIKMLKDIGVIGGNAADQADPNVNLNEEVDQDR